MHFFYIANNTIVTYHWNSFYAFAEAPKKDLIHRKFFFIDFFRFFTMFACRLYTASSLLLWNFFPDSSIFCLITQFA